MVCQDIGKYNMAWLDFSCVNYQIFFMNNTFNTAV